MSMRVETTNLATARRYIELLERFAQPEELSEVLHPDVHVREFPNRLKPQGSQSVYAEVVQGPQQGRKILRENRYEITNEIASGDWVVLEIVWTGTLAIPLGALSPGDEIKAYLATILHFAGGKIIAQHEYDCYEPFPTAA